MADPRKARALPWTRSRRSLENPILIKWFPKAEAFGGSGQSPAFLALAVLLLSILAPAAQAASLTVTVAGLRNDRGHVRIGVCTQPQFLSEHCVYHAIVSAHLGAVTVTIPGIAAGAYAIAAYQDETDVGHLRRSLFGIPEEGTGFSRDPSLGMRPPSFERCALRIGPQDAAVTITLRYF